MARDEQFKDEEPGLSHPTRRLAVRLTDDGQVLIQAGDYAGIVIDEETGVVTIYGSEVRVFTEDFTLNGGHVQHAKMSSLSEKDKVGEMTRKIDGAMK